MIYASDATRPSLLPHTITLTKGTQGPSLDSSRSPQLNIFRLYPAIANACARDREQSMQCRTVSRCEGQKSNGSARCMFQKRKRASVTRHVAPRTAHRDQHLEALTRPIESRACVWRKGSVLGRLPTKPAAAEQPNLASRTSRSPPSLSQAHLRQSYDEAHPVSGHFAAFARNRRHKFTA